MHNVDYLSMEKGTHDNDDCKLLETEPSIRLQLWEQANDKGYVVCLWINDKNEELWAYRPSLRDAKKLFKEARSLLLHLKNI